MSVASHHTIVNVCDIVGTSPLNPRPHPGGDLDGLKASIATRGVLQPLLLVTPVGGHLGGPFEALDGSRRLSVLQTLTIEGGIPRDFPVPARILSGPEAELREIALAANVHRLDLHPVERFEAFAALQHAGMSTDEIGAHFALPVREVRKALALGDLYPLVRTAWRDGEIDADQAAAFTAGDMTAQYQILGDVLAQKLAPKEIRARLRGDAVPATNPHALFARDEYLAAGGIVDDSLFEEQSFFRDARLLEQVSRTKLQGIADRIAEREGWGVAAIEDEGFADIGQAEPSYTPAEEARAEELSAALESHTLATAADVEGAEAELDAIEARAYARAIPDAQRGNFGVMAELDGEGNVLVQRGLRIAREPSKAAEKESGNADPAVPRERSSAAPLGGAKSGASEAPQQDAGSNALRKVLDTAIETAFRRAIQRRPDVAIMLALASLTSENGKHHGVRLVAGIVGDDDFNPLLAAMAGKPFASALGKATEAGHPDCIPAFAAAVGQCVYVRDLPLSALEPLVQAFHAKGVSLATDLDAAIDRVAYFKAATREAALETIRELLGGTAAAEASARKKGQIAAEAARVATDKRWLPRPLSDWAKPPLGERSSGASRRPERAADKSPERAGNIAEAMSEAIEKDVAGRTVERFLEAGTKRAESGLVSAAALHGAFVGWCVDEGIADVPAIRPFGIILTRLGLDRHRRKDGPYYRGIALASSAPRSGLREGDASLDRSAKAASAAEGVHP